MRHESESLKNHAAPDVQTLYRPSATEAATPFTKYGHTSLPLACMSRERQPHQPLGRPSCHLLARSLHCWLAWLEAVVTSDAFDKEEASQAPLPVKLAGQLPPLDKPNPAMHLSSCMLQVSQRRELGQSRQA